MVVIRLGMRFRRCVIEENGCCDERGEGVGGLDEGLKGAKVGAGRFW